MFAKLFYKWVVFANAVFINIGHVNYRFVGELLKRSWLDGDG